MWKYKCERDDSPIGRSNDTVESIPKTRRNAINSTHSRNIPVTRIMIFWLRFGQVFLAASQIGWEWVRDRGLVVDASMFEG